MDGEADDPRVELHVLASALLAHAERLAATGTPGLERATEELMRERGGDVARDSPPQQPGGDAGAARNPGGASSAAQRAPSATAPVAPPTAPVLPVVAPAAAPAPPEESVDHVEAQRRLGVLAAEVAACRACALCDARKQTVFARGNGTSGLCFVGEGPGADEDEQGFPFVGKAGELLDRMIAAMGVERDEVYVCNIVKCRPPENRKPAPDEIAACRPLLERQLELVAPTVIVALGATAVQGLLGTSEGITRLRGKWKLYKGRIAVMPTFHPAYLLRTPSAKRAVWEDLQAVLRQLGRSVPERK